MFPTRSSLWTLRSLISSLRRSSTAAYVPAEDLQYPAAVNQNHSDLASFLEYVSQGKLDKASTVYIGTHYEYAVLPALEKLGMSLQRIGGRSDYGIDLLGTWNLPTTKTKGGPLKVLVQCKAHGSGPSQVRELEGTFAGAPKGWRDEGVLALLVGQKPATKGVRETIGKSRWAMGYVLCKPEGKD